MTKYLFSLIAISIALQSNAAYMRVHGDSAYPVSDVEVYNYDTESWILLPYQESSNFVIDGVLNSALLDPIMNSGRVVARFNQDDTLIFAWDARPEWGDITTSYVANVELQADHGGVVLLVKSYVPIEGTLIEDVYADIVQSPTLGANDAGFTVPYPLQPTVLVRAAVFEIWLREIARTWVFALVMFGIGLIGLVRVTAYRIGRGKV